MPAKKKKDSTFSPPRTVAGAALAEKLLGEGPWIDQLFERMPVGIVMVDVEGMIRKVNAAFVSLFQYTQKDLLGNRLDDFMAKGVSSSEVADLSRITTSGDVVQIETHRLRKDGTLLEVRILGIPIHVGGRIVGAFGLYDDITLRKNAEIAIRASEERYHNLVDSMPDAIAVYSDGKVVFVNAEAVRFAGAKSRSELIGLPIMRFVHPDSRQLATERGRKALVEGVASPFAEEVFLRLDGTPVPVEVANIPLRYGEHPSVQVIIRDISERKQAEEALRESEKRYQELVERMQDGVYRSTESGKLLEANDAMVKMFGYDSREQMCSIDIARDLYFSVEDRENVPSDRDSIQQFRMRRKDGSEIWVEDHGTYVRDRQGKVQIREGVLRDITERKKMEDALRKSEERFRALVQNSHDVIVVVDANGKVEYLTESAERVFGAPLSALLGTNAFDSVHPHDRDRIRREFFSVVARTRERRPEEFRMIRPDGTIITLEGIAVNLLDDEHVGGVVVTIRDVTERRQLEERVRQNEEMYRSIITVTPESITVSDLSGAVQLVSPAALRMWGYDSTEEVYGKSMFDFVHPSDRALALELAAAVYRGEELGTRVLRALHKSGKPFFLELAARMLFDAEGKPMGLMTVGRDITDRLEADRELQESRERFRTVWSQSPLGMRLTDREGRMVMVNDAYCKMVGRPEAEMIGAPFSVAYSGHTPDTGMDVYYRRFDSGEIPVHTEAVLNLWDGRLLDVEISNSFIAPTPDTKLLLAVFHDVTARRKAERALRESEERFRAVVEQSADGIYMVDALSLQVVECNDAFCRLLGYSMQQALDLTAFNIIVDEYSGINREVSAILSSNVAINDERTYRKRDGSPVQVLESASVINFGGKRAICTIVRDISERKKLEGEREQLIRELQTALSNIRTLSGLIPICSHCKKIRDDKGYWNHLEQYLLDHSEAVLSHGICPDCAKKLYPEIFDK